MRAAWPGGFSPSAAAGMGNSTSSDVNFGGVKTTEEGQKVLSMPCQCTVTSAHVRRVSTIAGIQQLCLVRFWAARGRFRSAALAMFRRHREVRCHY